MILSLDPGRSCGYAVFQSTDATIQIVAIGAFDLKAKDAGEIMSAMRHELETLLRNFHITFVHLEQYFFNSKFPNGAELNYYLRGAVLLTLHDHKIPHSQHVATTWKKFVCGTARPSATQVARYGLKASKAFVKDALETKFDLTLPSTAPIGSKHLKLRHDTVDAIAIGIFGMSEEKKPFELHLDKKYAL